MKVQASDEVFTESRSTRRPAFYEIGTTKPGKKARRRSSSPRPSSLTMVAWLLHVERTGSTVMIAAQKISQVPTCSRLFVDELGREKVLLEVHETTPAAMASGLPVPHMAVLALFWGNRYGLSLIDTDQVNEIRLLYRRVEILEDQYTRAKEIVTGLRRLHAGTANEPVFEELPKVLRGRHSAMPYGPHGTHG